MKHSKTTTMLLLSAAALAGFTMTGCNSMDSRNAAASSAAADVDAGYTKLGSTLDAAIARLQALKDSPGTAESYLNTVKSVQSSVADDASALADARTDLKESGEKQVARMQEESSKIQNPDLVKDFVARSEKLRGYFNEYVKDSAALGDALTKGNNALNDAKVAVGANPTDAVIKMSKDSLSKAISAFKDAKDAVPDSQKALKTLREQLPQVAK